MLGWRAVFLLNVPLGLYALVLGALRSTINATRQVGMAVGIALLGLVAAHGTTFTEGMRHAVLVGGGCTALVTILPTLSTRDSQIVACTK
ncbi:hypothetical protein GCM10029964_011820 [Kibdelosporangium lantanae]